MKSKTPEITEYMQRHYPCQAIPHGDLTAIGEKFGVTRERVRQIANKIGITGRLSRVTVTVCSSCGKPLRHPNTKGICKDCRWVELPCGNCEQPVRRLASSLASRFGTSTNYGTYMGRVFCNRKCLGSWCAKNHGFLAHPENAGRGTPAAIAAAKRRREARPST